MEKITFIDPTEKDFKALAGFHRSEAIVTTNNKDIKGKLWLYKGYIYLLHNSTDRSGSYPDDVRNGNDPECKSLSEQYDVGWCIMSSTAISMSVTKIVISLSEPKETELIGKKVRAWDTDKKHYSEGTLIAILPEREYPYVIEGEYNSRVAYSYKNVEADTGTLIITSGGNKHTIKFVDGGITFDDVFIFKGTISQIYQKLKEKDPRLL